MLLSKSELEETLEDVRVECTRCVQLFYIFCVIDFGGFQLTLWTRFTGLEQSNL